MPSILEKLDFHAPPIRGGIFSNDQIRRGWEYYRAGKVRIVTANVNGSFAGIFGQVSDFHGGPKAEVSVVVRLAESGDLNIEGRASTDRRANTERVVALLLAARAERAGKAGETESPPAVSMPTTIRCFRADIRAGFRHWDDAEARKLLENMPLARIAGDRDGRVEAWLRRCGMRRIAETMRREETKPACRDCFAFPAKTLSEQELRWADFLANHPPEEEEGLGAVLVREEGFGLQVVRATDWFGELEPACAAEGIDWFDLECGIRLAGERVNLLPFLLEYLREQPPGFRLSDLAARPPDAKVPIRLEDSGRWVAVPADKLHSILRILAELFDKDPLDEKGRLGLHGLRAAQLAGGGFVDRAPDYLLQSAEEIERLRPRTQEAVFPGFEATLRPYQEEGFRWLQFLRERGWGGVLADDMGLGKTVQTLCHLYHEKKSGRADRPSLIVAPKSVTPNWEKEIKRFAPSMTALVLQGHGRKKYHSVMRYSDLVIVSYPVLLRDAAVLLDEEFHYVVLDEAQTIKNARSQVTKIACDLRARHRLCLTGTPIENHLGELWTLFHFLMPGYLGSEDSFRRCYRIPIEKERDDFRRRDLAERVTPLLLRRTKDLVAADLPPKTEMIRTVELTPKQVELYEAVRASLSRDLKEEIQRRGFEASKILILDALLKLRQICCHPKLLKLPAAQKAGGSAKLNLLMELLPDMVEEGRRILIFSQFAQMLKLIEAELEREKIGYLVLTGETKNRGPLCDDFQAGKEPVFLISLRAGGTGLNLTAADTVIHFDPWWNPALENQASDRAHRIGQRNPVFIYKLIGEGTIEEKIVLLQRKKQALFQGILEGAPQKLEFSEEILQDLLAPIETAKGGS